MKASLTKWLERDEIISGTEDNHRDEIIHNKYPIGGFRSSWEELP